ncbi:hypothetical protein [Rubrivirga sp.]|uniref:hypothetical protein n=1 Tax=Rubrivirga sp. TaxID=1885344 RepID=UPI003C7881B4
MTPPPLLAAVAAALLLGACTTPPAPQDLPADRPVDLEADRRGDLPVDRPADFALEYGWTTGTIPPPYNHSRHLEITPSGAATYTAERRYVEDDPSTTVSFDLEAADLDRLYADLEAAGAFQSWTQEDNPPVGGGSWWLRMTAGGDVTEVPSFVVGDQYEVKNRVEAVLDGAIPPAAQAQIDAWLEGPGQ